MFDETLVFDPIRVVINIEPLGEPFTLVVIGSGSDSWSRGSGIEVVSTISGLAVMGSKLNKIKS